MMFQPETLAYDGEHSQDIIQETQEENYDDPGETIAVPEKQVLDAEGEEADDESGLSENEIEEEEEIVESDDDKPPPLHFDEDVEDNTVPAVTAADDDDNSDDEAQVSDTNEPEKSGPSGAFEDVTRSNDSDDSNQSPGSESEGDVGGGKNMDDTQDAGIPSTQHIMSEDEDKNGDVESTAQQSIELDRDVEKNDEDEESVYDKSVSISEQIDTAGIQHEPNSDDEGDTQGGDEMGPAQNELINDIFGSSDSEGEFEGFGEEELAQKDLQQQANELGDRPRPESDEDDKISDFDKMLMKKKEENARRRKRRKDVDIINDQDDKILNMINQMRRAADEDRQLNTNKQVALNKLKLLKSVLFELRKCHLQTAFVENGVLLSIAEWLSPLPDQSLPHLQIRTSLLQILEQFPPLDSAMLRESGIGKVVMLLYKHPKEVRENRIKAGKLINNWARPIFQLTADFGSMTREDREKRDLEKMPPMKKKKPNPEKRREDEDEDGPKGPGDRGFVARARVPMPSFKDYVVRPKMNVDLLDDEDIKRRRNVKREKSRLDKYIKLDRDRKTKAKNTHAIKVNLSGGKT